LNLLKALRMGALSIQVDAGLEMKKPACAGLIIV